MGTTRQLGLQLWDSRLVKLPLCAACRGHRGIIGGGCRVQAIPGMHWLLGRGKQMPSTVEGSAGRHGRKWHALAQRACSRSQRAHHNRPHHGPAAPPPHCKTRPMCPAACQRGAAKAPACARAEGRERNGQGSHHSGRAGEQAGGRERDSQAAGQAEMTRNTFTCRLAAIKGRGKGVVRTRGGVVPLQPAPAGVQLLKVLPQEGARRQALRTQQHHALALQGVSQWRSEKPQRKTRRASLGREAEGRAARGGAGTSGSC